MTHPRGDSIGLIQVFCDCRNLVGDLYKQFDKLQPMIGGVTLQLILIQKEKNCTKFSHPS